MTLIAGLLAIATFGAVASARVSATTTTSDDVVDCPEGGLLPQGSQCTLLPGGEGDWLVVSAPTPAPPCERVETPPPDAVVSTCRVESLADDKYGSALISYATVGGDRVRAFVFPSGDIIDFSPTS